MKTSRLVFIGTLSFWSMASLLPGQDCPKKPVPERIKRASESTESLDINHLECYFSNEGTFGEYNYRDGCFYPAGQRDKSLIYTAGLWIVGIMGTDTASAVSSYGTEFQPGKILENGQADDPGNPRYHIYKYNRGDSIDPDALEQGCPDSVMGDQMLFCVFNDLKSNYGMFDGPVMGLEVQMTAFGFNVPGPMSESLFVKYRIINKGSTDVTDAYAAFFFDADLGFASDDLAGSDSLQGMIFFYNYGGFDKKYGSQPPAFGCDILRGPRSETGQSLGTTAVFVFT
jgi:hypothetical protein